MLTAMLTHECSGSAWGGVIAALIMAVIPAHTMRSIAGGYDNESLAVWPDGFDFLHVIDQ